MGQSGGKASEHDPLAFLAGGGEMGQRARALDWSKTPVGPVGAWPHSLRTAVSICLGSRYPIVMWWGNPAYTMFYNDAYVPILGVTKHPGWLGRSGRECWSELWPTIGPMLEGVFATGEATWSEDLLLVLRRNLPLEETYFTFSYSPIRDDTGEVGGVFCAVTETTGRVIGERRLWTLRDLGRTVAQAKEAETACKLAARTLAANPADVPFALIYLLDGGTCQARLAAASGLEAGSASAPDRIDLGESAERSATWPLRRVFDAAAAERVPDLAARFGPLPGGPWPEPAEAALILPIAAPGQTRPTGFLVTGLSPRRVVDADYRSFLDLIAGHVGTAVANARAYEGERRRAEALAELDRAKTAFFSNVSHEFRTPLTLMLGPVEDLLAAGRGELSAAASGQLEVVHRNGLRLLRLVNSLLDFSRIEAGRVRAVYRPTDLAAFTADLASVFRAATERAGLRLTVDCPKLSAPVYVDRDMWEKVVLNLLSNAFKFTFEGEIAVALRQAGEPGALATGAPAAELVVRDTGTGIPVEELPRLFERFHRVENARGRTHEGSGIGLALVQELAKLHGGTIRAESVVGKGTTFTVSVPLGSAHLPPDQIGEGRAPAPSGMGAGPYVDEALRWLPVESDKETGRQGDKEKETSPAVASPKDSLSPCLPVSLSGSERPRVLVADDNADMRQYVVRLLTGHYRVEAVPDGEAALAAARQRPPDLILTDVMMPRLDGFGLLRELRADPRTRGVPVILLSARAGEESRVEGLEAGADDYLVKPFGARELLASVGAHLEMARLRRESGEALRESEARFRTLADNVSQFVWIADAKGWIYWYNRRWYDYTGTTLEEMQGWGWKKVHHPDHVDRVVTRIQRSWDTGEPWEDTFPLRGKDGVYRWFLSRALPIGNEEGKVVQWFGTNTDVTEQREMAEDLRKATAELSEADRRKDEFLATLAHELRNPLAPIRNGLQVMKLAGSDGDVAEQMRAMMERQIEQMVRLIDDLLDLSRVSRGKVTLKKERVELERVVRQAVENSLPLIEAGGHDLTVNVPPDPIYVDADATRLAQVFSNLLNNAAKYTERGGRITLTVDWASGGCEPPGTVVVVSVRDTGVGIPAAMLPKVFEMFTQVERSLEKAQGGLGIGLSLVKGLVEMHGGGVEAKSEGHGKGSEFVVRLPAAPSPDGRERAADADGGAGASARRILVVDDKEDAAISLVLILKIQGNETRIAHDGLEALEVAAAFRPDVVLLDIGMPKLNGYDACRRLREQPWGRGMVLVALTGWGQEDDRRRSHEAGFDFHMVKPVDPAALERLLAELQTTA